MLDDNTRIAIGELLREEKNRNAVRIVDIGPIYMREKIKYGVERKKKKKMKMTCVNSIKGVNKRNMQ